MGSIVTLIYLKEKTGFESVSILPEFPLLIGDLAESQTYVFWH